VGPAGLTHGILNDRLQFDTVVSFAAGRNEAQVRGLEMGILGDVKKGKAFWEVSFFDNRFVKEDGLWKVREMRVLPEHFRGGTGEHWEWPKILPMWWGYKNPVSGRQPELFLPDCVACEYAPEMSMVKHGYLLPSTDPIKSEE